jgi:ABC-type nitrate/sulfonate/bicarbonate transport system permease component
MDIVGVVLIVFFIGVAIGLVLGFLIGRLSR